jgi:hypothetical protein
VLTLQVKVPIIVQQTLPEILVEFTRSFRLVHRAEKSSCYSVEARRNDWKEPIGNILARMRGFMCFDGLLSIEKDSNSENEYYIGSDLRDLLTPLFSLCEAPSTRSFILINHRKEVLRISAMESLFRPKI